ncbi:M28 family metallopeptidase [Ferrimonas lipolytica]|uniref:M28 family peptidase n=1 Tax=Ferrimonas lipolytica TaxID=2724191 RepID=A0A6H1UIB8_9GAMM|nr:M28 family metallopeptidase [Ferrimonas lipolytica]QIZ78855.1 M28 family peptidase [Ferrimonas lipolytica]
MRNLIGLTAITLLAACSGTSTVDSVTTVAFDEDRIRADIKELSSDEYLGRMPTTTGETLTLAYLTAQFKQMGLKPANGDSYLQAVPMQRFTTTDAALTLGQRHLDYPQQMVLNSYKDQQHVAIENSDIVFVGYGINAPEYQWNDYANLNVRGKTVVMLVNDPGFATQDPNSFKGGTMTYYGRWDYKFAEAGRQGAAAALIVHDTKPASYPWSVVKNSWTGAKLDLANSQDPHPPLEGWISLEVAKSLFTDAGLDFEQLSQQATVKPTQISLGLSASANIHQTIDTATSYNVAATLPGSSNHSEQVLYTGHWDHIGAHGDDIYNGAMDNASGIAAMLEIARQFSRGPQPQRSVTFLAVTGEEQGLLGSRYYAANPLYPLQDTVGLFNIDSTNVFGKTKDYAVVGLGHSQLERYVVAAATAQGRSVTAESNPAAGSYFRSDHFSFVQKGVPAIYAKGGSIAWDESTATYRKQMQQEMKGCYHNPCDTYRSNWDLSGTLQDMQVYFNAGNALANSNERPGFHPSSEFHRLRPAQ